MIDTVADAIIEKMQDEIDTLEAEAKRLQAAIREFVYANDTHLLPAEEWEQAWEAAMDGLRATLKEATP